MKLRHPFFEATVIGIDVLNMKDVVDDSLTSGNIDWMMNDFCVSGDLFVCRHTICAQNDVIIQQGRKRCSDLFRTCAMQYAQPAVSP